MLTLSPPDGIRLSGEVIEDHQVLLHLELCLVVLSACLYPFLLETGAHDLHIWEDMRYDRQFWGLETTPRAAFDKLADALL